MCVTRAASQSPTPQEGSLVLPKPGYSRIPMIQPPANAFQIKSALSDCAVHETR